MRELNDLKKITNLKKAVRRGFYISALILFMPIVVGVLYSMYMSIQYQMGNIEVYTLKYTTQEPSEVLKIVGCKNDICYNTIQTNLGTYTVTEDIIKNYKVGDIIQLKQPYRFYDQKRYLTVILGHIFWAVLFYILFIQLRKLWHWSHSDD